MGKCFPNAKSKARDELRHAALSEKFGREIVSSKDLTDKEVDDLLTLWEHYEAPFSPSDAAIKEIVGLAKRYQDEKGQESLHF